MKKQLNAQFTVRRKAMTQEQIERAANKFCDAHEYDTQYETFLAGAASRQAEIDELLAILKQYTSFGKGY